MQNVAKMTEQLKEKNGKSSFNQNNGGNKQ